MGCDLGDLGGRKKQLKVTAIDGRVKLVGRGYIQNQFNGTDEHAACLAATGQLAQLDALRTDKSFSQKVTTDADEQLILL
jgi:hypothetical protein